MSLLQTQSFQLATYSQGNPDAAKMILALPGKCDTKDYPDMKGHVDYFGSKGYFSLSFDPPGTWESSGDITLYTMTNYLKAVDEIITYYKKPTFLIAHSRGGKIAMQVSAKNNFVTGFASLMSVFGEGFTEQPVSEWKSKGYLISKRDDPFSNEIKEFHLPYSFHEDEMRYTVMEDIVKDSRKPKLFDYGKEDVIVPQERVEETFALFANPKELHAFDGGHDYRRDEKVIKTINTTVEDFLQRFHL